MGLFEGVDICPRPENEVTKGCRHIHSSGKLFCDSGLKELGFYGLRVEVQLTLRCFDNVSCISVSVGYSYVRASR